MESDFFVINDSNVVNKRNISVDRYMTPSDTAPREIQSITKLICESITFDFFGLFGSDSNVICWDF